MKWYTLEERPLKKNDEVLLYVKPDEYSLSNRFNDSVFRCGRIVLIDTDEICYWLGPDAYYIDPAIIIYYSLLNELKETLPK